MADDVRWGIDLGGTKIEGAVVGRDGRVTWRDRIATEADRGYDHILGRMAGLVAEMERAAGPRPEAIGIGTPGALDLASASMKNCNTICLNGRPLLRDLAATLGLTVKLANDADCFALAEATLGAARGRHTVFGVIMGTGVGGGIVVGGALVRGPNGIAGEWGHTTLVPGGNPCYCGRRGCVETYLSGPAVERAHAARTGQSLPLAEIASRAAGCGAGPFGPAGRDSERTTRPADPECETTIRTMCAEFGRAIAQVINILDPDAIVLGGGAGQVPQLRTWGFAAARENVFNTELRTPFLAPALGDSAGVVGAALLT